MKRLQIQLPTPLYKSLKIVSKELDYSLAELIRKSAEQFILYYPNIRNQNDWKLPKPKKAGLKISDPATLREIANQR